MHCWTSEDRPGQAAITAARAGSSGTPGALIYAEWVGFGWFSGGEWVGRAGALGPVTTPDCGLFCGFAEGGPETGLGSIPAASIFSNSCDSSKHTGVTGASSSLSRPFGTPNQICEAFRKLLALAVGAHQAATIKRAGHNRVSVTPRSEKPASTLPDHSPNLQHASGTRCRLARSRTHAEAAAKDPCRNPTEAPVPQP